MKRRVSAVMAIVFLSGFVLAQGAWAQTAGSGAGQMQEGLMTKVVVGTTPVGTATVTVVIDNQNYTLLMPPSQELEIWGDDGNRRTAQELGQYVMVVRYRLRQDAMTGTVIDRIECPCPTAPSMKTKK